MFDNQAKSTVDAAKTASLQTQLLVWCKHIASSVVKMRELGNRSALVDAFFAEALFAAANVADAAYLTRLNLKADLVFQLVEYLASEKNPEYQDSLEKQIAEQESSVETPDDATIAELAEQGAAYSREAGVERLGATVFGLQETIIVAMKGLAPVALRALKASEKAIPQREFEARGLRLRIKEIRARDAKEKEAKAALIAEAERLEASAADWTAKRAELVAGIYDVLAFLATDPTDVDALCDAAAKTGRLEAIALELLEPATYLAFGTPVPTVVRASATPGKCVLFSGDDLDVLLELLEQTEFSDLNVWTRGEAIAAHSFPAFKKFKRLAGHYGGSWADQRREFDAFPGAIVVAGTPVEEPGESYRDYLFAAGASEWSGPTKIAKKADGRFDFAPVTRAAADSPGFFKAKTPEKIATGFGGDGLDGMIDKAARAFRQDRLKKIFVVGGEDGSNPENDYFGRLFDAIPAEATIATFGDVKFRFNRKPAAPTEFGTPRLLDLGRADDANAVVRFAQKFGKELDRTPENAPVAFFIGQFGEKSLANLLAILALGYRNVFVGPTAPDYWTPEIVAILREKFGLRVVGDPESDVAAALN